MNWYFAIGPASFRFIVWRRDWAMAAQDLLAIMAQWKQKRYGFRSSWTDMYEGSLTWYLHCGEKRVGWSLRGPIRRVA